VRFEARVLLHCETMLEANTIPLLEMAVVATCCLTIDLEARMRCHVSTGRLRGAAGGRPSDGRPRGFPARLQVRHFGSQMFDVRHPLPPQQAVVYHMHLPLPMHMHCFLAQTHAL